MTTGKLHLDVSEWLKHLELDNYLYLFQKFRGVEEMLSLSERDLKDLGIKNGSHRAIIATSLVILRDKYEKGHRNKTGAPRGSIRKSRSCDSSPRESWTSNTCKNRASWNSTKEGNQAVIHSFSLSRKPSTGTEEATSSEEKLENGRIALLSRPPLDNVTRHVVEQNSCVTYSNLPSLPKKSSNSTVGEDKQTSCDTVPFLTRKSSDSLLGVNNNVDQPTAAPSLPLKTSLSVERGVVVKFQTSENKAPSLPRKISSSKQLEDVQQQQQVINNSVPPLPRKNLSVRGNIEKEQQIFNANLSKKPCERTNVVDSVDLGTTAKTSPDSVSVIKEVKNPPTVKGSENCPLNTESSSEYCSDKGSFQISNESVRVPLVTTTTTENKEVVYANTSGTSSENLDDVRDTGRSHTGVASDYNVRNDCLHNCTWYHGSISRHRAEQLTCEDGDFLVRDQTSRDGSFVLTCRWNDHPLHFVIEKVQHQQRLVYQFADKNYNSITELVTYLMENKTVLSSSLNAVLIHPVARTSENAHPVLSAQSREKLYQQPQPEYQNSNNAPRLPPKKAPLDKHQSAPVDLCSLASSYSHRGPTKSEQTLSLPSIPDTEDAKTRQHGSNKEQPQNRPTGILSPACTSGICNTLNVSSAECSLSNPKRDLSSNDKPPPKPSRIPSIKYTQNPRIFSQQISDNYFEKGVLTTDKKFQTLPAKPVLLSKLKNAETEVSHHTEKPISMYTTDPGQQTGKPVNAVPPLTPKKLSNDDEDGIKCPNKIIQDEKGSNIKNTIEIRKFTIPDMKPPSTFCLSTFSTVLLPSENKPLDNSVKAKITSLLKENGPKLLAIHLSKNDFDVFKYTGNHDLGLGVKNGLELLTLPQGEQLRKDILERFECTKYLVAATVLTIEEPLERAQLVSKWIEVAVNSKTSLGNLYGFSGVMKGLSLPQVSRLQDTWLLVRQNFTENAFTYESKMRPLLKSLEINSETEASNSCIPYLVCLISILQRHLEMIKQIDKSEKIETNSKEAEPVLSPLLPWEHTTADYGLQMLLNHLETGRTIVQELHKYQKKCETLTENVKYDDQLLDLFRTEFHLKFLWGSKGAKAFSKDRYLKLEQILTLLSQNREPS
ncbi:breast cancer anti-estrogen resistance protein 3 homolog isoform X2 [Tachypleus tridentatus]